MDHNSLYLVLNLQVKFQAAFYASLSVSKWIQWTGGRASQLAAITTRLEGAAANDGIPFSTVIIPSKFLYIIIVTLRMKHH